MPRDGYQENERLDTLRKSNDVVAGVVSVITVAKQRVDELRAQKATITAGLETGLFDAADAAVFNGKAQAIALAILKASLLLSDLAGGEVAVTVGGETLTQ